MLDPILSLPRQRDYVGPNGSEVRLLAASSAGGLSHVTLDSLRCSLGVRHCTVEELWFVVTGEGELWRAFGKLERIDTIRAGDSLRLAAGVRYQFRAFVALKLIVATMPTWPGPDEAVETEGPW